MSSGGSSSSSARAPAAPSLPQLASSARDALSSRLKPMGGKLSRPRRRVASRRGASYVEASAVADWTTHSFPPPKQEMGRVFYRYVRF